jgi:hypothetical protein
MKVGKILQSLTVVEMVLFLIFILYLVFPIATPDSIATAINSPLGMMGSLIITIYLFFYTNPFLGILFIFVAYDLLRRSSRQISGKSNNNMFNSSLNVSPSQSSYVQYTPSQDTKNMQLNEMNPASNTSLEEEVVKQMAPIGHSDINQYIESSFKPVTNDIHNAFSV